MSSERQLSPTTRYHICRFLRQPSDYESAKLLAFKVRLSADDCTHLNEILHELYPNNAELGQVMLQLDNLVYIYTTLGSATASPAIDAAQLDLIKREIFQLLGYRE